MMMMSFYRKSLHSFFSFYPFKSEHQQQHQQHHHGLLGLGLISDSNVMQIIKSPNILQSSSLMIKSSAVSKMPRRDPGGVGFFDDVGGGVDGLMSCTESLGFESSGERLVNDELMSMEDAGGGDGDGGGGGCAVRVRRRRGVERNFPPPLTSLNQHGHPNFYLRPVRKDGRLELTEVRIERTEILRACREDGRLRLHLIKDEERQENDEDNEKIIEEEDEEEEEEEEEEEGLVEEGKREFRRCVEVVNHQRRREHHRAHHHQRLDVWRQHCVTTS